VTVKDGKPLHSIDNIILQLWSRKSGQYFCLQLPSSHKGWHEEWFLMWNLGLSFPAFFNAALVHQGTWGWVNAANEQLWLELVLA
jgi:hypothetical protein